MALSADRHPDATARLLQTGCTPSPWLKFATNKLSRPFRPHTMRAAFYNAVVITQEEGSTEQPSIPALITEDQDTNDISQEIPQELVMYTKEGEPIVFTGQRRLGRNPNTISRFSGSWFNQHPRTRTFQSHSTARIPPKCFSCESENCTVKRCPQRKDFERIRRNQHRWIQNRRLPTQVRMSSV